PAGGEPVRPTTPSRDPAAEAAALAAFEDHERRVAEQDLPVAAPPVEARPEARPDAAASEPPAHISQPRMAPLGKALTNPPVVVFDKVTKRYGSFTAIK